jgi:hypothetical protein
MGGGAWAHMGIFQNMSDGTEENHENISQDILCLDRDSG